MAFCFSITIHLMNIRKHGFLRSCNTFILLLVKRAHIILLLLLNIAYKYYGNKHCGPVFRNGHLLGEHLDPNLNSYIRI